LNGHGLEMTDTHTHNSTLLAALARAIRWRVDVDGEAAGPPPPARPRPGTAWHCGHAGPLRPSPLSEGGKVVTLMRCTSTVWDLQMAWWMSSHSISSKQLLTQLSITTFTGQSDGKNFRRKSKSQWAFRVRFVDWDPSEDVRLPFAEANCRPCISIFPITESYV
jgi:hypothetical protein